MRQDIIDEKTAPYAALLLRVSLGIMFIAHSLYLKVVVFTVPGTVQFFESLGLPGFSAYAFIAAEVIGGTALALGV
jgi:putative oxidoreductase